MRLPRSRIRTLMLVTGSLAIFSVAVTTRRVPIIGLLMVVPLFYLLSSGCSQAARNPWIAVAPDPLEPE